MLLVIDHSISELATRTPNKARRLINNLMQCDQNGQHHVVSDQGTIITLTSLLKGSEVEPFLIMLNERAVVTLIDLDMVTYKIIIVSSHDNEQETETVDGKTTKYICYDRFMDPYHLRATELILEDSNDEYVYIEILKYFFWKHRIKVFFKHNLVNGYGGNIHREFELAQSKPTISLSLAEADSGYPNAPLTGTSRKLMRARHTNPLSHRYVLRIMEVENLLPLECLMDPQIQPMSNGGEYFLEVIESSVNLEARLYFDLKLGIRTYHLRNTDYCNYWTTLIEGTDFKEGLAHRDCIVCDKCKQNKCHGVIIPNVFIGLLKAVREKGVINTRILASASPVLQCKYEEIGHLLFSCLCSTPAWLSSY